MNEGEAVDIANWIVSLDKDYYFDVYERESPWPKRIPDEEAFISSIHFKIDPGDAHPNEPQLHESLQPRLVVIGIAVGQGRADESRSSDA